MAKMIEIQELEELENDKKFKQYMNPGRSKYIRQVDGPKCIPWVVIPLIRLPGRPELF